MNARFTRSALWTVAVRIGLFAALWWVVTEGAPDAWLVGIPAVLLAARKLGAQRAELVLYRTSGEASGDYDQVVGYAGLRLL